MATPISLGSMKSGLMDNHRRKLQPQENVFGIHGIDQLA
uniref:Uncharacterized protein n=1 Tax=Arundo donax TaxID=35708 RepID=A0A0A9BUR1_ARUDO